MPGLVPPLIDERELLVSYVAQQRQGVRNAAHGLTDAQARLTPLPSSLSVGGLIKHLAAMEHDWIDVVLQCDAGPAAARESEYGDNFVLAPHETLAHVLARYDEVARRTESVVNGIDLDQAVPVPRGVPWFPADVETWSVRWVLLHLIEETARHAGHADIIREALDGATMYELMAAVEGWPDTDWLKAWKPAG
jgi:uncharacterized damage-inducible protein DinB